VVDRRHRLVSGGDDRAAAEGPAIGIEPEVPQPSEDEGCTVGSVEIEGLLEGRCASLRLAPLIKA
jgi:hypothetical protein